MAYITNYNFNRITKGFDVPADKNFKFDDIVIWMSPTGKIIDQNNPTQLFARWDVNDLLIFKSFCKNTKLAASTFYRKLSKPQDSYRYVQSEKSPSYHKDANCERLNAEFERITIPEEIREQGIEKVKEFRNWWKENETLRRENPIAFVAKLNIVFKTNINELKIEIKENSGVKQINNYSIEEINDVIYKKFKELFSWAKENKKREDIFIRFAYISYMGNSCKPIIHNHTSYTETEIKEVLKYIHPRKLEIIQELKNLYLRTYNPKLEFEQSLLDELGFEPCAKCSCMLFSAGSELLVV